MDHRHDGVLSPGEVKSVSPSPERLRGGPVVIVECVERIPCDPCVTACAKGAITIAGDLNDTPTVDDGRCDGCGVCVAACPGLAIFVVDASREGDRATVMVPYEFIPLPAVGEIVTTLDREGREIGDARVTRVLSSRALDRTPIVSLDVPKTQAMIVRHFRKKGA
jgi:Fe-S-cluster-containing hydrogenase component 2